MEFYCTVCAIEFDMQYDFEMHQEVSKLYHFYLIPVMKCDISIIIFQSHHKLLDTLDVGLLKQVSVWRVN